MTEPINEPKNEPKSLGYYLDLFYWSQTDLANAAGISTSPIAHVLRGEAISRRSARKICDALSKKLNRPIMPSDVKGLHIKDLYDKDNP